MRHHPRCDSQQGMRCSCKPKQLHVGQRVIARSPFHSGNTKYRLAKVLVVYNRSAILDFGRKELWIVLHGHIKEG